MNRKSLKIGLGTSPILAIAFALQCFAVDPENEGAKYEDDAWYDVSEWFDGNDYNPTDEAIGRWDDEKFSYADNRFSSDLNSDQETIPAEKFYGEDYDDGYAMWWDEDKDGNYEKMARYHDSDGDYLNDSYATYHDSDGDGMYDTYDFSELSHTSENAIHRSQVAQSTQKGLSGKAHQVAGTVAETKMVERLGKVSFMVKLQQPKDNITWVDFGHTGATLQLFKGDSFLAFGPVVKRGDKYVLVATTLQQDGRQRAITRTGRRYTGTVESTKTAKVKGDEHLVVKLKTEDGKKLTVDMGDPASEKNIQQGSEVTVTGIPVKVGDRVILIADKSQR
ncbi:hypothetical protein [Stieleria varia]|uniref:Uncharacterized protein n=1 Tax=Stieleria varia TaxID=2528005 RepID=A0A5C6AGJ3_9BACT|nr:hypothetical protein [Stieleria varia]TWT98526.1 hypothetical protein Pla52n_50420 [Stieleria varia]